MSDALYPLTHLIERQSLTWIDRTLKDEFEAGNTATRRLWPANTFKRRFGIKHAKLTFAEKQVITDFFGDRGTYDSFWYRDNIDRTGNAKVRFVNPLRCDRVGAHWDISVELEEINVLKRLVSLSDVTTAAGAAEPFIYLDPQRERRALYGDTVMTEPALHDAAGLQTVTWASGGLDLQSTAAQYQHHKLASNIATSGNIAEIGTGQPALTLFFLAKVPTPATYVNLLSHGTGGVGATIFITYHASGVMYAEWGLDQVIHSGLTSDTWYSWSLVLGSGSNTWTFYRNGTPVTNTGMSHNLALAPLTIGGGTTQTRYLGPVLGYAASLTQAQVKALHNLFAAQYGMATVS